MADVWKVFHPITSLMWISYCFKKGDKDLLCENLNDIMYRRYTLEEVKRKIIDVLQSNGTGLSGVELSNKTGINRMTITKYLDVLYTIGLIKKKKVGSVNVWFLETGVTEFEFPINYLEVQQKFMNAIMIGDQNQAYRIIVNIINSNIEKIRILTDVILPSVNTLNELYNRGRMGVTERISILNIISEIVDLLKLNLRPEKMKPNAHAISVVGSEDRICYAKIGAVGLQILGWDSSYIGNVEHYIDPFFDIDFQRYVTKVWNNKKGLMIIVIYSSGESSLRFLSATIKSIREKLKGEVKMVLMSTAELLSISETTGADYVAKDVQSLIEWTENQYNVKFK
jgi:predicted transcriptional regulator